jgi:hypothetical protein
VESSAWIEDAADSKEGSHGDESQKKNAAGVVPGGAM